MNINVDNLQSLKKLNTNLKNKDFALWFYANWCGHCKDMEDEWNNLEKECKNKYNVARVRDDMKDQVLGGIGENVMGFPKIIMVSKGQTVGEHEGTRTSKDIMNTIINKLQASSNKKRTRKRSPCRKRMSSNNIMKKIHQPRQEMPNNIIRSLMESLSVKGKKGKRGTKGRKGRQGRRGKMSVKKFKRNKNNRELNQLLKSLNSIQKKKGMKKTKGRFNIRNILN